MRVPLLLISGPVGVGKTTVAIEVGNCLEQARVPHTVIDYDNLRSTWPPPATDRFSERLAQANLRDVWRNCAAAGSMNLIIANVIESDADALAITDQVPGAEVCICLLRASNATLRRRVRRRELGAGRDWHLARAVELAAQMRANAPSDFAIDADRASAVDVAREITGRVRWESPRR